MPKKEIAQDFLKLAAKGQSRKAFELYVADNPNTILPFTIHFSLINKKYILAPATWVLKM